MNEAPTANRLIAAYISIRTEKQQKEAEHKAAMQQYDDKLKKLEAALHIKMHQEDVKALPTEAGTAYITTVEQATVTDMNALLEFVKANEAWHLLEKRVSKVGVRELVDADQPVPPGVNWRTSTSINVRKASER